MIYAFGECALDTPRYVLHRAGRVIQLRRKVFQVLTYLLAHHDRVVSKEELYTQVWPNQFISDAALDSTIKAVRQAIGDSGHRQQLIQTVYSAGYRFVAEVAVRPDATAGTMSEAPQSLPDTVLSPPPDVHDVVPVPPPQEAAGEPDGRPAMDAKAEEGLLRRGATTPIKEWKVVTVLCCAPAEAAAGSAPPEPDARYLQMHDIYALARNAVQRYGGTLQPVVGERIMAVFGAPAAQEDHAQRAVLAALELQRRRREARADGKPPSGDVPAVRLGLHTGVVAVGGLEDHPATAGAVVGDTVTGTIALQEQVAPGTILCSEATAEIALCTEQGFALYLARGTILRGWAMAERGQGAEGLAQMRQGLAAYQATGAEVVRPYYLAFLAKAHGKVGQAEEGLTMLAEALAAAHKTGERIYEAELYRLKGALLLVRSPRTMRRPKPDSSRPSASPAASRRSPGSCGRR